MFTDIKRMNKYITEAEQFRLCNHQVKNMDKQELKATVGFLLKSIENIEKLRVTPQEQVERYKKEFENG